MIEKPKLGPNDEEVDDYRDFDDEHSERGSKLDDFAEEDEEDMDEITPETPSAAPIVEPTPVGAEVKEAPPAPSKAAS